MTHYMMLEVDEINVNPVGKDICLHVKKDLNHASIYFTHKQLKKLIAYAEAELLDKDLVENGVGILEEDQIGGND